MIAEDNSDKEKEKRKPDRNNVRMNDDDELDANLCKEFLKASQRGDLTTLKEFVSNQDVKDWTIYRHVVSGDTALHLASREGRYDVVRYLCEAWDKPYFKTEVANKDMKRPLHEAAQFARFHVLEYLLEQGAAVDPLKRADWTPLMLACTKTGPEATRCVDILLKHGAASDMRNKDGWTSLMVACRTGNKETVQILIRHSPKRAIYTKSKNGRSPLHVAAFHGHRDIIDCLLSEDRDLINIADSSGSTPILESIKSGDLPTLEHLVNSKADFRAVDKVGQNVLHLAAQSGNVEMIKFIVRNNLVDLNSEATLGITPLMLAQKNKQLEAVGVLNSLKITGN